jgi:hypothetical protein
MFRPRGGATCCSLSCSPPYYVGGGNNFCSPLPPLRIANFESPPPTSNNEHQNPQSVPYSTSPPASIASIDTTTVSFLLCIPSSAVPTERNYVDRHRHRRRRRRIHFSNQQRSVPAERLVPDPLGGDPLLPLRHRAPPVQRVLVERGVGVHVPKQQRVTRPRIRIHSALTHILYFSTPRALFYTRDSFFNIRIHLDRSWTAVECMIIVVGRRLDVRFRS